METLRTNNISPPKRLFEVNGFFKQIWLCPTIVVYGFHYIDSVGCRSTENDTHKHLQDFFEIEHSIRT